MNTEQERAAFEAWARDRYPSINLEREGDDYRKALAKDYWSLWKAARATSGAVLQQKGDFLDGVNIKRLREALTFLGRGNGAGEEDVCFRIAEYVNAITSAVLACKALLRSGAPAVPQGWRLVPEVADEQMQRAIAAQFSGTVREAIDAWSEALAAAPQPPAAQAQPVERKPPNQSYCCGGYCGGVKCTK